MKKLFFRAISATMVLLASVFMFSSCNQSDVEFGELVYMVPSDAPMVMDADLQMLKTKISSDDFEKSALYEVISGKAGNDIVAVLCNDSIESGIANDELVFFLISEEKLGGAFMLNDAKAFESKLKALVDIEESMLKIDVTDGIMYCTNNEVPSMMLLWNETKALFLMGYDLENGLALFNQTQDKSICTNKEFATFYADKKELAIWMNMECYMDMATKSSKIQPGMAPFPLIEEFKEQYEGMYTSYNVEFLDGKVVAIGKITPEKKAKAISQTYCKMPNKDLLSAVPANTYFLTSFALNTPEYLKAIESSPELKEFFESEETKEITKAIDGDIVISLCDFASGPIPMPNAVIGISVKDSTITKKLLDMDGIQFYQKEGYTAATIQIVQVYMAQNNGILLVSTDENVIKTFAEGKNLDENLMNSKHKGNLSKGAYYYTNLDLENYPDGIKALLQGKIGESFDGLLQSLCFENVMSYSDWETGETYVEINMKDKDTNSLATILNTVDKIVSMQIGAMGY